MSFLVLLTFSVILVATQVTAVTYQVTIDAANTAGAARFNTEVGSAYARQTMSLATDFIGKVFQQTNSADTKDNVQQVILAVESMDGVSDMSNNQIHLSSSYVQGYSGDLKREVTGILYHEMTHVWQWNGNGQAPDGLIEGMADFMRLRAGYAPTHWVKPGQGDRWDQGHDVTAYFLDYCSSLRNGFVADLNAKMKSAYSDAYFNDLLGKSANQLWTEYKAKYNH